MPKAADLPQLLDGLDPDATLVQRHLWLMDVLAWVRGDGQDPVASVARVRQLLEAAQASPDSDAAEYEGWGHPGLAGVAPDGGS